MADRTALIPDKAIDHILGPVSAPVVVIEYADLECPNCRQAHGAIHQVLKHHGANVRYVFRHFPLLEVHPHAELAAEAAEVAGAQGKFWPYIDLLFDHQNHLDHAHLLGHAEKLELDMLRFRNELDDHVYLQRVQEHIALGQSLRVRATPTFYVNGVLVDVSFGMDRIEQAIVAAIAAAH
jgi:protein-disulfide isomerase